MLSEAEAVLERVWGYPAMRYHQRRAVLAVLRGRDCLAMLPTGGGKSICFQLPALIRPGLTLVVSPLISLMQDQVQALRAKGVAAAYLSSTQPPEEQAGIREALTAGQLKLLYVAPERLERIVGNRVPVSFLAVDEAHCISEWGHEFRPHYRALGRHRRALGRPVTLAVTATATPATRRDVVRSLGLSGPVTVTQSFDRPNLWFGVRRCRDEATRLALAVSRLRQVGEGSAIVYVPTRNRTDGVAQALRWRGLAASPYHAGLPPAARKGLLDQFLDGSVRVMVATNAFGMGIDKPDVRLVLHLGIPARPEAYYQEAGRAGRDGAPGRCEVLWVARDLPLMAHLSGRGPAAVDGRKTMQRYVRSRRCRRAILLGYLGDETSDCAGCDSCRP